MAGDPSVRELEEHALDAWPALATVRYGGWVFRFAGGYTKRANSASALAPDLPFAAVHHEALRHYAGRGLPPVFRISPLAGPEPDRFLDALGYRSLRHTVVLTAPVPEFPADPDVRVAAAPDGVWLEVHDPGRPADRDLHARILAATDLPAAYATLFEDGRPVAFGRAVAGRGLAGLFSILTLPPSRGRGAGRRVVETLLAWARGRGAGTAYLQVEADNAPALALYRRFGFTEAYGYRYRTP
jgi:GNAT superfamily N-acetyltransferase